MRPALALIGLPPREELDYQRALAAALPDEAVVPFRLMDEGQRARAEIAIVANPDPADVAALPRLVWVQSLWAGVERLLDALGPAAPHVVRLVDPELARTMAEAVLAWTHYLQRDMPAYARQQREATWRQLAYRKPSEITVGLLGLGALGGAAAARLADAGFEVVGWSRAPKTVPHVDVASGADGLAAVLGASDIVVCLVPLTPQTRGLLDAGRLALMKPGAALINVARGPVVVTADLLAALDADQLSHAVLDVFDAEPLDAASPLWRHPKVTVLPHITAPTDVQAAARVVAANVRAYRETGCLPVGVDMVRGY